MRGLGEMNRREGRTEMGIKAVQKNKQKKKNFVRAFARIELDVRGVEEETDSQGGLSRREQYRVICSFSF